MKSVAARSSNGCGSVFDCTVSQNSAESYRDTSVSDLPRPQKTLTCCSLSRNRRTYTATTSHEEAEIPLVYEDFIYSIACRFVSASATVGPEMTAIWSITHYSLQSTGRLSGYWTKWWSLSIHPRALCPSTGEPLPATGTTTPLPSNGSSHRNTSTLPA